MKKKQIETDGHEEFSVIKLNPVNLSFKDEWRHLEQDFLCDYAARSVKYIRQAFLLGIFCYSVFGILDVILVPEKKAMLWFIRYAVVCPVIFGCILLSYWSGFQKWSQGIVVFVIILAGSGISVMVAVTPPPATFSYYAGVILVLMLGYGFARARFIWASLAGWINIAIYEFVAVVIVQTPGPVLINNNFFFICANVIGMFSCYALEFYTRNEFFMARLLLAERERVTELNRDLEKKVRNRTFELQKTNNMLRQEINHRETLQTQLTQAQKMESIGRLAGGVAHDFNNMLSIILGHSEMLLEDLDETNSATHNVCEIQKAAERSANLTRQLLAFARKQTIAPKVINLNAAVEGMLKMLRRLIGENIHLVWLPKINVCSIKIDPSQIDQVLANLCVNARDAIKDVGKIIIETDAVNFDKDCCNEHAGFLPGDYVMIAISDNGCGMNKEAMENLFEPFYTTKDIGEGTGLGLATVYGIVKQNNGFINVYSEPNRGTTFRIYFPRHVETELPEQKPEAKETDATGCETILLVEDEKAILKMTAKMLERMGYTVLSASTPAGAVDIGKSHANKIDLLITDVVMPGMNGRDLADRIAELSPNLNCLFMSGYTANVIAHHGVLDQGVQFIQKPFSRQDLAIKVREVLDEAKSKK